MFSLEFKCSDRDLHFPNRHFSDYDYTFETIQSALEFWPCVCSDCRLAPFSVGICGSIYGYIYNLDDDSKVASIFKPNDSDKYFVCLGIC